MRRQSQNLTRWSVYWPAESRSPAEGLKRCTSQKPALASVAARHHQTARVGLVVKAGAEVVRLWLESNAQTSLVCVGGHASEAADAPIVFSFQCTDRFGEADIM